MKQRRRILILAGIAIFFLAVGLLLHFLWAPEEKTAESERWVERTDLPEEKILYLAEEMMPLVYERSRESGQGKMTDIYVDEGNNEYRFEGEKLIAYYSSSPLAAAQKSKTPPVTEEQAAAIAEAHARVYYESDFEKFTFERIYKDQALETYDAEYYIRYGEDDFIYGPLLLISVAADGTVCSSTNSNRAVYETLNESDLEGVGLSDMEAFADRRVREAFGEGLLSHNLSRVDLDHEDGRFLLRASVELECRGEKGIIAATEIYEIPPAEFIDD